MLYTCAERGTKYVNYINEKNKTPTYVILLLQVAFDNERKSDFLLVRFIGKNWTQPRTTDSGISLKYILRYKRRIGKTNVTMGLMYVKSGRLYRVANPGDA